MKKIKRLLIVFLCSLLLFSSVITSYNKVEVKAGLVVGEISREVLTAVFVTAVGIVIVGAGNYVTDGELTAMGLETSKDLYNMYCDQQKITARMSNDMLSQQYYQVMGQDKTLEKVHKKMAEQVGWRLSDEGQAIDVHNALHDAMSDPRFGNPETGGKTAKELVKEKYGIEIDDELSKELNIPKEYNKDKIRRWNKEIKEKGYYTDANGVKHYGSYIDENGHMVNYDGVEDTGGGSGGSGGSGGDGGSGSGGGGALFEGLKKALGALTLLAFAGEEISKISEKAEMDIEEMNKVENKYSCSNSLTVNYAYYCQWAGGGEKIFYEQLNRITFDCDKVAGYKDSSMIKYNFIKIKYGNVSTGSSSIKNEFYFNGVLNGNTYYTNYLNPVDYWVKSDRNMYAQVISSSTTLPLFETREQAESYLLGNTGIETASNYKEPKEDNLNTPTVAGLSKLPNVVSSARSTPTTYIDEDGVEKEYIPDEDDEEINKKVKAMIPETITDIVNSVAKDPSIDPSIDPDIDPTDKIVDKVISKIRDLIDPSTSPKPNPSEEPSTTVTPAVTPVVTVTPSVSPSPTPSDTEFEFVESDETKQSRGKLMTGVFPFCVPFDLIYLVEALKAEPQAPKWVIPIKYEKLGISEEIIIDFSMFETIAEVCRVCFTILFILGLIVVTRKLIKG